MISTRDLSQLPDLDTFRRLTRSLAMLDAIVEPEWEFRYYSFNASWGDGLMMASMRDGSGNGWFALISDEGIAISGLDLDTPLYTPDTPPPGLFEGLPAVFEENFLHEPAFDTANSTFCIWRLKGDPAWSRGTTTLPPGNDPDGSAGLLALLNGDPGAYVEFVAEYYEQEILREDVEMVYRHEALSEDLVERLNPGLEMEDLVEDLEQIGYPDAA